LIIPGRSVFTENLAAAFFNTPAIDIANGINPLLRSLGTDFSQATDVYAIRSFATCWWLG
jgi:hypothetical protein